MNICKECGNDYELHSTDGARCPKNQGNLIDGKLEFFATHFDDGLSEAERLKVEIAQLREALTQANELYNAVEAMNLELTERITQDELAFGFMREANTLLTADVKRLTAELAQCKHALDDEGEDADVCKCGHTRNVHIGAGCLAKPAPHERTKYCGCDEFELVEDACSCGHSLDSHTKSGVHPCGECECLMFWAKVTE